MNKIIKRLFTPLAVFAMAIGIGVSVNTQKDVVGTKADENVLSATAGTIVNSNTMSFSTTNFDVNHYKGTDSNFASYSPWRVYTSNYVTFKAKGSELITSVEITTGSTSYAAAAIGGWVNSIDDGTPTSLGTTTNDATITKTTTGNDALITPQTPTAFLKLKPSAQTRWSSIKIIYTFPGSGTPVEGVSISGPSSISMVQYETLQLEAVVNPTDATNKAVSWSSSDDSKVSVDANGLLTANASTTSPVNIIVETQDGGFQDTISVSVTPALYSIVEYNITSKDTFSVGGTIPVGSSSSLTETYNTSKQMTGGNSQTVTLDGYNHVKISQIILSARSNSSTGAGNFSYSLDNGQNFIDIIPTANFNTTGWYGAWSSSYVDVVKDVNIIVSSSIILKVAATANSLYVESYTLKWEVDPDYIEAQTFANEVMTGIGANANGNCAAVLTQLETGYNALSTNAKLYFDSLSETLFINARARMAYLNAWVGTAPSGRIVSPISSSSTVMATLIIGIIGISSLVGYYFVSKKTKFQ